MPFVWSSPALPDPEYPHPMAHVAPPRDGRNPPIWGRGRVQDRDHIENTAREPRQKIRFRQRGARAYRRGLSNLDHTATSYGCLLCVIGSSERPPRPQRPPSRPVRKKPKVEATCVRPRVRPDCSGFIFAGGCFVRVHRRASLIGGRFGLAVAADAGRCPQSTSWRLSPPQRGN